MTDRYVRLAAVVVASTACSAPIYAQQDTVAELRAKAEQRVAAAHRCD